MPLIHPEHLDQLAVREMPEPKILISDLNVYYGNFHALKNVSLPIPKGCVTAFSSEPKAPSAWVILKFWILRST